MTKREFFAGEMFKKLGTDEPAKLLFEAQKRATEAGHLFFSGASVNHALEDLEEEMRELKEAIEENHSKAHVRNEVGDVFFSLINICRLEGVDVDEMMQKIAERWITRKKVMEDKVKAEGYTWANVPDEVSSRIWKEIKQELKQEEYK